MKVRHIICCLFILSCLIAVTASAQKEERVFAEYLQYLTEQEGYSLTDAIKEIQSLQQGKESLIQSYIKTEQDLENLEKSAVVTGQSEFNYSEKQSPPSEFSPWEGLSFSDPSDKEPLTEQSLPQSHEWWDSFSNVSDIEALESQELKPPRFRIAGIKEYTDADGVPSLDITLKNSGTEGDLSVAVMTKDGVLISQPFFRELSAFAGTKVISFQLMQQPQQIAIQLESDLGTLEIPVFLRSALKTQPVVINANPFEAQCLMGESVEYRLTLSGSAAPSCRYNLRVEQLPKGITSEILQSQTLYPLKSIKFSPAFPKHEIILRLTITTDLPFELISKPIAFLFSLTDVSGADKISETLSITPAGVGRITIDSPQTPLTLSLGETKAIKIAITNIGSQDIEALALFPDHTVMGLRIKSPSNVNVEIGERKEVELRVEVSNQARIGRHNVSIGVSDGNIREKATIPLMVMERKFSLLSFESVNLRSIKQPLLLFLSVAVVGCVIGVWIGNRRKKLLDDPDPQVGSGFQLAED